MFLVEKGGGLRSGRWGKEELTSRDEIERRGNALKGLRDSGVETEHSTFVDKTESEAGMLRLARRNESS